MSKDKVNEEVYSSATRNSLMEFFDGLKDNTTKKFLSQAQSKGMPSPVITKMKKLQKEKDELDKLIKKYSK